MYETILTIGLFDKDTCLQELSAAEAIGIISDTLLNCGIYGATLLECRGIYRMESTGEVVQEPSIRAEFCEDRPSDIARIVAALKSALNQESIMVKRSTADISFL